MKINKYFHTVLLAWLISLVSINATAGDTLKARHDAALRYMEAVSISKLLDETLVELAKQLPEDRREYIIIETKKLVNVPLLKKSMLEGLVKVYTAEEMNALADFYGSDVGKRVMAKYSMFVVEVMPIIQQEIIRSAKQALANNSKTKNPDS